MSYLPSFVWMPYAICNQNYGKKKSFQSNHLFENNIKK